MSVVYTARLGARFVSWWDHDPCWGWSFSPCEATGSYWIVPELEMRDG